MELIHKNAAGIDIGSKQLFVSVTDQPVRSFGSFTEDIFEIGQYMLDNDVTTVAMEATGSYWFVLYDVLSEYFSLDVWLVDGRQTKQLPGRKTDVKDCQWIQQMHSYGLLSKCHVASGAFKKITQLSEVKRRSYSFGQYAY